MNEVLELTDDMAVEAAPPPSHCVFAGVPIAFGFGLAIFGYLALATRTALLVLIGSIDVGMSHRIVLAVPLFVFLGLLIEMTGMARAMVAFPRKPAGRQPTTELGGLAGKLNVNLIDQNKRGDLSRRRINSTALQSCACLGRRAGAYIETCRPTSTT